MSGARFTVTKSSSGDEEQPITDLAGGYGSVPQASVQFPYHGAAGNYAIVYGENTAQNRDHLPLADNEESLYANHMALYEDDLTHQGKISQILTRITSYQAGIAPNVSDVEKAKGKPKANLGTVLGVYLPCIQNIFGVLLFLRLTWIVGLAGVQESFCIVFICCASTMLTSFSMSAIATNGVVPAGGSYFMISRSLGPEFGGAVGLLFYFGTCVAASMYIIGAVEILVKYMAPELDIFGNVINSYRLYGSIVLLLLIIIVFIGVAFVSKFATLSLACVLISIISIYIGIFVANPDRSEEVCYLGNRLLTKESVMKNNTFMCNKNVTGPIHDHYCSDNTTSACYYFNKHETIAKVAIPGLGSGVFTANTVTNYTEQGKVIGTDDDGDSDRGEIIADLTSSFMVLLAIYFPSVTGIMAGSNRSGDLADAQKSIPIGTIAAVATTSSVCILDSIPPPILCYIHLQHPHLPHPQKDENNPIFQQLCLLQE